MSDDGDRPGTASPGAGLLRGRITAAAARRPLPNAGHVPEPLRTDRRRNG